MVTVEKLRNIQALRAIAALMVLAAHIQAPLMVMRERSPSYTIPRWLTNLSGASGVDIFFVISGYVICRTAAQHRQGAWHFFRNRFARIAPFHYLVSLVILALVSLRLGHSGHPHTPGALWNSFFFLPVLATGHFDLPVNSFAWTLCFEMWFYSLFALLLRFVQPRRAALLLPAILFTGAMLLPWYSVPWFFPCFAFDPLCLEFGLGCLIFFGQELLGRSGTLACLGAALLLYLFLVPRFGELNGVPFHSGNEIGNRADYFHAWERVLVWGLPAAILFLALLGLERHFQWVLPRPLILLGDASYSLYLLQPLMIILANQITRGTGTVNPVVPALSFVVPTIALAVLTWRYLELPLTHLARRWLGIAPDESRAGEPSG